MIVIDAPLYCRHNKIGKNWRGWNGQSIDATEASLHKRQWSPLWPMAHITFLCATASLQQMLNGHWWRCVQKCDPAMTLQLFVSLKVNGTNLHALHGIAMSLCKLPISQIHMPKWPLGGCGSTHASWLHNWIFNTKDNGCLNVDCKSKGRTSGITDVVSWLWCPASAISAVANSAWMMANGGGVGCNGFATREQNGWVAATATIRRRKASQRWTD